MAPGPRLAAGGSRHRPASHRVDRNNSARCDCGNHLQLRGRQAWSNRAPDLTARFRRPASAVFDRALRPAGKRQFVVPGELNSADGPCESRGSASGQTSFQRESMSFNISSAIASTCFEVMAEKTPCQAVDDVAYFREPAFSISGTT